MQHFQYFSRTKNCFHCFQELAKTNENQQKMIATLYEAKWSTFRRRRRPRGGSATRRLRTERSRPGDAGGCRAVERKSSEAWNNACQSGFSIDTRAVDLIQLVAKCSHLTLRHAQSQLHLDQLSASFVERVLQLASLVAQLVLRLPGVGHRRAEIPLRRRLGVLGVDKTSTQSGRLLQSGVKVRFQIGQLKRDVKTSSGGFEGVGKRWAPPPRLLD